RGGPLALLGRADESTYRVPAIPLGGVLSDARVLLFLAVWFGINILFGLGSLPVTGGEHTVAWQAHIGGFLAGVFLFFWVYSTRPRIFRNSRILLQCGISQLATQTSSLL